VRRVLKDREKSIRELNEHVAEGEKYRAIATHIAEIAHELKQPLVIIGGFARRMATKLGAWEKLDPDTQPECFNVITKELKRLEEMLAGLMGIARQDKLHLEPVNPNVLVREVLKINAERLKEQRVTVENDLQPHMGGVPLDRHLFEHVIRNLLANAIEASPPHGTISIQTCLSNAEPQSEQEGPSQSHPSFEMRIGNQGNPIPREELENIFLPFYTT
ncbi:MAG: histidine kinase dimerization/phospho-acceptor domain-containing protein, partial [Deltaproteobacteria bacterium]